MAAMFSGMPFSELQGNSRTTGEEEEEEDAEEELGEFVEARVSGVSEEIFNEGGKANGEVLLDCELSAEMSISS